MSVGQEFWMVASGCSSTSEKSREGLLGQLQNNDVSKKGATVFTFDIPDGENALQFGSFDNLIRLTEELQKYDSQIESVVHRLERQTIELDPTTEFLVTSQRQEKPFPQYMKEWVWDEAKYPRSRSIADNMVMLMKAVNQFDDEARNKTQQYNDLKTQKGSFAKKDQALNSAKDLIDVFVPEILLQVNGLSPSNDFVYSEYLETVVVILPKGADIEFKKSYERLTEQVVPSSAKHFKTLDDKEGNMLWRVVVFKSKVDEFKKAVREKRWLVRDFVYSPEAYEKLSQQRIEIDAKIGMAYQMIKGLYKAAWSDTMVAWMHIKAARIFVESVLRFGMAASGKAPKVASFVISPLPNKVQQVRKAIDGILGTGGAAGVGAGEDDEEFYSYVSISMTPFVVQR